jgi:hypothetical protein
MDKSRQISELLDAMPEHEAAEMLQELAARRAAAASSLPKQISEHDVLRNTLLPVQNNIEFELNVRHPIAYPTLYPLQVATLSWETVLGPSAMTWQRCVNAYSICSHDCRQETAHRQSTATADTSPSSPARQGSSFHSSDALASASPDPPACTENLDHEFASMPLFRNRLGDIKIEAWTEVPIENELAIRILSFNLELEYSLIPFFDADLFIEDLVRGRHWFCSKLLVNSIMCWACVSWHKKLSLYLSRANQQLKYQSKHICPFILAY